jgi:hypothetical protein
MMMEKESKFCEEKWMEYDRSSISFVFDALPFRYGEEDDIYESPKGFLKSIDGEW